MGALSVLLIVVFIIVCVLAVLLVLIQGDSGDGLGSLFGSSANNTLGAKAGNIFTKATTILTILVFILSFSIAFINKTRDQDSTQQKADELRAEKPANEWWKGAQPATETTETEVK